MKLILSLLLLLSSLPSFAHIRFHGEILLDKETIKVDKVMTTEAAYTFLANHRLINIYLPKSTQAGIHTIKFKVFKRHGVELKADGNSEMKVKDGEEATMSIQDKKSKTKTVLKVNLQMVKG